MQTYKLKAAEASGPAAFPLRGPLRLLPNLCRVSGVILGQFWSLECDDAAVVFVDDRGLEVLGEKSLEHCNAFAAANGYSRPDEAIWGWLPPQN